MHANAERTPARPPLITQLAPLAIAIHALARAGRGEAANTAAGRA